MNELTRAFVPADAIEIVAERVGRIAKRATKKGFPAPTLRIGVTEDRPIFDEDGKDTGQFAKWTEAIIEGEPIRFAGWNLLAVVSFIEEDAGGSKPVLDRVPGTTDALPEIAEYNYCDYCKTARRRNETFIVSSTVTGEVRQVGRNCLRDFLGYSPEALIAMYEAYRSLQFSENEIGGWAGSATKFYSPAYVLEIASRIVAKEGFYISKARAEEDDRTSTSELVRSMMSALPREARLWEEKYPASPDAQRIFDLTMAAIPALDPTNEYESKVLELASAKGVQWRHVGTLASAVIQGLRALDRKGKGRGESKFLGQIGERITVPVKVTMKRKVTDQFDRFETYVIRMVNGDNDILWWASWSMATSAIEEGQEFDITGTVKGHEYDKLTKRPTTVLTRCKAGELKENK